MTTPDDRHNADLKIIAAQALEIDHYQKQSQRAQDMSGAATLEEAINIWEQERRALAEAFDEVQAHQINFRQYDISMTLAARVIDQLATSLAMFMTQKDRDLIDKFREQLAQLESRRAFGRQLIHETVAERR